MLKTAATFKGFSRKPVIAFVSLFIAANIIVLAYVGASTLPGDVNANGKVDITDLSLLLAKWNSADAAADFNTDGKVGIFDLSILLSHWGETAPTPTPSPTTTTAPTSSPAVAYTFRTLANPDRTQAFSASGSLVATFTKNARTVVLTGPTRTFSEPANTPASVTTTSWVRVAPSAFNGTVDTTWLGQALKDTSPDLFQLATQYMAGAPVIRDSTGRKIAGDADYGPLQADGSRAEGADFNDYMGIAWNYGSIVDQPEVSQLNSLDCSGYVRMLWGYRSGLPLIISPNGTAIPRRSFEMIASAPGIVTVQNNGAQITNMSALQAGDIVGFDADTNDGTQIDHVGMFLGVDSEGHYRFISSRKSANGPTMGDLSGKSVLDGTGHYANAFRSVRRF